MIASTREMPDHARTRIARPQRAKRLTGSHGGSSGGVPPSGANSTAGGWTQGKLPTLGSEIVCTPSSGRRSCHASAPAVDTTGPESPRGRGDP